MIRNGASQRLHRHAAFSSGHRPGKRLAGPGMRLVVLGIRPAGQGIPRLVAACLWALPVLVGAFAYRSLIVLSLHTLSPR